MPIKITLAAVGDINLGRAVNWQIQKHHHPNFPFRETVATLSAADLTIGNLESPFSQSCSLTQEGMVFCSPTENASGLAFAGFDLMNLSNNHIHNYGTLGVEETVKVLKQQGIDYFGLEQIVSRQIADTNIAFIGLDDTVKAIEKQELNTKIKEAEARSDLVFVNFHWGAEYQNQPSARQKELAHLAIEAGADLIIGHHPHVLQPVEYYQDKPILYSLGNFVFDQPWSQETMIGVIALITIENKKIIQVNLLPIKISNEYQPTLLSEPQKSEIIDQMTRGMIK